MSDNDKMREDYDRLAKLAEKQNSRIKELDGMVVLQGSVQHCACGDIGYFLRGSSTEGWYQEQCEFCYTNPKSVFNARNSTVETVAKYKAELTEPLRSEVAMLHSTFSTCHEQAIYSDVKYRHRASTALTNTQATAQAYEAEVKAKALEELATKFETGELDNACVCIADEIRATSKKG